MKPWPRHLVVGAAFAAVWLAAASARAETWDLELKRLEPSSPSRAATGLQADRIYRSTYPQHFSAQVGPVGKSRITFSQSNEQAAAFKRIVKTEPEYTSEYPFRGVAKLGTQEFAFALDAAPEKAEAKQGKSQSQDAKAAAGSAKPEAEKAQSDSADAKAKKKPAKAAPPKPIRYSRLFFDANHNGDLTDDPVIEAESSGSLLLGLPTGYVRFQFPRVDVTVDVDGTKVDYAFLLSGYVIAQQQISGGHLEDAGYSYASLQLNAAAYREGDIVLAGKKRHVVLIDFNSNGRFDDALKLPGIRGNVISSDGRLYPQPGDVLLIDPDPSKPDLGSPYDVTSSTNRHNVSKLINLDGRYYDVKISAAGDKLSLAPSSVPLGSLANPHDGFRALLYGDLGCLTISGSKDTPTSLPAGRWKLLSYTIDRTGYQEPADEQDKGKKAEAKESSLLAALSKALASSAASVRAVRGGSTTVSAAGTKDCPTVEVRKGETAALPFGPPYKPVVKAASTLNGQAQLSMSLVGSGGEVCTALMVKGSQPPGPEFTITDPKGEVVESGTFRYG